MVKTYRLITRQFQQLSDERGGGDGVKKPTKKFNSANSGSSIQQTEDFRRKENPARTKIQKNFNYWFHLSIKMIVCSALCSPS